MQDKSITMNIVEAIRSYAEREQLQRDELRKKIPDETVSLDPFDHHGLEMLHEGMMQMLVQIKNTSAVGKCMPGQLMAWLGWVARCWQLLCSWLTCC